MTPPKLNSRRNCHRWPAGNAVRNVTALQSRPPDALIICPLRFDENLPLYDSIRLCQTGRIVKFY